MMRRKSLRELRVHWDQALDTPNNDQGYGAYRGGYGPMRSIKLSPGRQLAAAERRRALLLPMSGLRRPDLPGRLPSW